MAEAKGQASNQAGRNRRPDLMRRRPGTVAPFRAWAPLVDFKTFPQNPSQTELMRWASSGLATPQEICMSVVEKMKSYMGAYSDTDIRSLLHADHEQISALTEQITSDESKQKRVRAFDELKPFLTAHARAEEQAVYAPLVKVPGSPDSRADANEGFVEHSLVDVLMERLSKTDLAATDAWKAHAQGLPNRTDLRNRLNRPISHLRFRPRHKLREFSGFAKFLRNFGGAPTGDERNYA